MRKPRRRRAAVGVALVLAGAAITISAISAAWLSTASRSTAAFDEKAGFKPGMEINEAVLAATDPDALYEAMLRNQLMRPVHQVTTEHYSNPQWFEDAERLGHTVRQTRVDYEHNRVTEADTDYEVVDGVQVLHAQSRCVDGEGHRWSEYTGTWSGRPPGSCIPELIKVGSGDGIAPGGLSAKQADRYLRYLRGEFGDPISVGKPTLFRHDGKSYVRLPVKVTPLRTRDRGYTGMMLFQWALQAAGISPLTYPYSNGGAAASGVEVTYYIDPATTLPAYSFQRMTPVLNSAGEVRDPGERLSVRRSEYAFPERWRPYDLANPTDLEPIALTWHRDIR
ncbi:hypothetical protein [Saccharopolyspora erythraea]|uniref:hypothetical protein n=1 Tax=Saccharopolyspora erythraea TaxID=1836 RepID=UPI001E353956|nr:hypothetical protein [Saccharopolyspora erythraea]